MIRFMSDRYGEFLRLLEDPSHYVKVSDVPVFDQHKEVYYLDPRGKMCASTAPGARKRVKHFDKKTLEEIARNCNARDKTGTLAPLTRGHTIPDENDESKQPEIMGYAKDWRVRFDPRLKKWVIAANYYLRADHEKDARTYPRTSVELWPGDDIIDPIALLRRTPQRDLGQWTYGKDNSSGAAGFSAWRYSRAGRPVFRYAMETKPMADPWEDDDGEDMGGADGAPFGESSEMPGEEPTAEQFAKHCLSHPYAKKYGMADGGLPGGAGPGSEDEALTGDPTAPPSATTPMPMGKRGGVNRYARPDGDNQALEAALRREAEAEGRNWVQQLSTIEGIAMDQDKEVIRFAKCYRKGGVEACVARAQEMRAYRKERIDRPTGRVVPSRAAQNGKPQGETLQAHDAILRYQKTHNCDWDEAEAAIKSGKR